MDKQAKILLDKYLNIFNEEEKLQLLNNFLKNYKGYDVVDWNNFYGHIVASAFVYSKKENLFLTLYHKEFNTYVYPGGHVTEDDASILDAAKREVTEETGITNYQIYKIVDDENVPIDIDIHNIAYNKKLDLPPHYHFDFRYFFIVDEIVDVTLDHESSDYKWVPLETIKSNLHYGHVYKKLEKIIEKL